MTAKNPYEQSIADIQKMLADNKDVIEATRHIHESIRANTDFVESQKRAIKVAGEYAISQSQLKQTLDVFAHAIGTQQNWGAELASSMEIGKQVSRELTSQLWSGSKLVTDTLATINMAAGLQIPLPKLTSLLSEIKEHPEAYDVTPEQEAALDAELESRRPGVTQAINKLGELLHLGNADVRRRLVLAVKVSVFMSFLVLYVVGGGTDFETAASFGKDMGVNPLEVAMHAGDRLGLLLEAEYGEEEADDDEEPEE